MGTQTKRKAKRWPLIIVIIFIAVLALVLGGVIFINSQKTHLIQTGKGQAQEQHSTTVPAQGRE